MKKLKRKPLLTSVNWSYKLTYMRLIIPLLLFINLALPSIAQKPRIDDVLPNAKCQNSAEDIKTTFVQGSEKNTKAIELIDNIMAAKKSGGDYKSTLTKLLNTRIKIVLGEKPNYAALEADILKTIGDGPTSDTEMENIKGVIACQTARFLHQNYLDNPEALRSSLPKTADYYAGIKPSETTGPPRSTELEPGTLVPSDVEVRPKGEGDDKDGKSGPGLFGYLFFILLAGGAAWLFSKKYLNSKKNEDMERRKITLGASGGAGISDDGLGQLIEAKIASMGLVKKQALDNALARIEALEHRLNLLEGNAPAAPKQEAANNIVYAPQQVAEVSFFSPPPTSDGVFYSNDLRDYYEETISIYQIFPDERDPNRANFTLIDDPEVLKQAAGFAGTYLSPACILKGFGNIGDAVQLDIEPGTLVKDGNNWRIERKAEVNWR